MTEERAHYGPGQPFDADATLTEIRELARRISGRPHKRDRHPDTYETRAERLIASSDVQRLTDLIDTLDDVLSSGGRLPAAWRPR